MFSMLNNVYKRQVFFLLQNKLKCYYLKNMNNNKNEFLACNKIYNN